MSPVLTNTSDEVEEEQRNSYQPVAVFVCIVAMCLLLASYFFALKVLMTSELHAFVIAILAMVHGLQKMWAYLNSRSRRAAN